MATTEGPHLLPMAEHWYHAVPVAPPEKGIEYARRAAMWALGHVAHHQAEEQLQCALELVGHDARRASNGPTSSSRSSTSAAWC